MNQSCRISAHQQARATAKTKSSYSRSRHDSSVSFRTGVIFARNAFVLFRLREQVQRDRIAGESNP